MSPGINDIKPFVPAKDYQASLAFYQAIGFTLSWSSEQVSELELGDSRILLQNYYVKELAENFMLTLNVSDLDSWWQYLTSLDLPIKFPGTMIRKPAMQPWGVRVLYLHDPCGVLWHVTEDTAG